MYWTGGFSFHFKVYVKLPTFPPYHNCNIYLELKWQMLGSPIYDGQIRVIYVDYLLLSCMPVYMLLYVCYMHMIPSFHNKWHFHFKVVFESRPSNGAPVVLTKKQFYFFISNSGWQEMSLEFKLNMLYKGIFYMCNKNNKIYV